MKKLCTLFLLLIAPCLLSCEDSSSTTSSSSTDTADDTDDTDTPTFTGEYGEPTLVAFIGDQGYGDNAEAVLELILAEGTDMVLHQGDFDYNNNVDGWDAQITNILGADFPYFACAGNHDTDYWLEYREKLYERLDLIEGASCEGSLGTKSACTYKEIFFILSGVGTYGSDHETYLEDELAASTATWKICSWHKNQRLMQVGGKSDEVGWEAYDICREAGAIIATGHEHSYSRTHLMSDFENQEIASTDTTLVLEPGKTFAFVNGLGGQSIREQDDELAAKAWWAAVYSEDQDANYGALFCDFNYNEVLGAAYCYFKDIDDNLVDEFYLLNQN